jgi:hypothetical protein
MMFRAAGTAREILVVETQAKRSQGHHERLSEVLARVRHRQLAHALAGRVAESCRYARWAQRLRQCEATAAVCAAN